ncbi:UNVERIFIED_CONTAM: hypothetical protein RF648_19205 [Kocuria sp. CPCC 205274]
MIEETQLEEQVVTEVPSTIEVKVKGKTIGFKSETGEYAETFVPIQGRINKSIANQFVPAHAKVLLIESATKVVTLSIEQVQALLAESEGK